MATKPMPDLTGTYIFDPEVMDEMEHSEPTIELETPFRTSRLTDTVVLDRGLADDGFLDEAIDFGVTDIFEAPEK